MQESVSSSAEQPFVTVIVPTYNDWPDLRICIDSLSKQTYPTDSFEVIIANNNPANSKPADILLASNMKIIEVEAPGSYAARNAALKISRGDVIAFTDSDCQPSNEWLAEGVKRLQRGCDRVAGNIKLIFYNKKLSAAEIYEKAFAFRQDKNAKNGISVTANLFTSKKVFDSIGMFDSSLMSGGDVDWNQRASQKGFSICFSSQANVCHPARHSLALLKMKSKRVAGGTAMKNGFSFYILLKFLLPPVKQLLSVRSRRDMVFKEKLVASLLACYINLYRFVAYLKVALKFEAASRE